MGGHGGHDGLDAADGISGAAGDPQRRESAALEEASEALQRRVGWQASQAEGTDGGVDGGGRGFQAISYSSQAKYPALFATAATTCVLGFIFTSAVLALSWLALHKWHDSFAKTDT